MKFRFSSVLLISSVLVLVSILLNLNTGFLKLHLVDFISQTSQSEIAQLRLNRSLVLVLVGIAIPTSGFLLQEYFQNPLAGPSVLGISSVAGLGVAFYIFFFQDLEIPEFLRNGFMSLSAIAASLGLLIILLIISKHFREPSYIIIFGVLISSLAGAIITLLEFYADNQSLKNYILWSFGANNMVSRNQILVLSTMVLIGCFFCFKSIKPLIGNALGFDYAQSFGVNLNRLKLFIILSSSLLSASVTAFFGPVFFIGIVVPHFCRMLWNPAQLWHQWLINMLVGTIVMQVFSIISELTQVPLNVISAIFGVPVILLMISKPKY